MVLEIISYVHPIRTYVPCTGVGRHMNEILLQLLKTDSIHLELLVSQQWLKPDNQLDVLCPIRSIPTRAFPMPENPTERSWKLFGLPKMDRYLPDSADWLYAPMETYFPISKCPVAVTIHDVQAFESDLPWSQTLHHRSFRYKWGWWVRRTINHSRVIFTVSEFSKQRMVELLDADADKIIVVGNGVAPSFFKAASVEPDSLSLPVDSPYVFMVGGLRQKKGGDHFLAVAEKLHQRHSNIQIVIAGASDLKYVQAAEAHPNIKLLGVVSDQALPVLMRGSLCLLFLSLYEGFGIPALEAMAAAVPAVVANRASLPEVVGDAGIVVEPKRPDDIVDVLIEFERNDALREQYIQKGREHVQRYTWENCAERVIEALNQFS